MKTQAMKRQQQATRRATWTLQVVLRSSDGVVLARERVTDDDLGDMRSELWMDACLRRGCVEPPLSAMPSTIAPEFDGNGGNIVLIYRLETERGGQAHSLAFTPASLEPVAMRTAERLITQGKLVTQSKIRWQVTASCRDSSEDASACCGDVVVHEIEKPLEVVRAPIETVKSTARWIGGALKRREFPAFYTADALADATRHCRRGWALDPAIETGAALIGVLCSCPRTGEFFAVVTAAEPIEHAEETRLSLTFSATSWDAIEQRLEQLRKQSGCAALRLLGQAHGHPFMPAQCREDERSAIRAHTAYASSDDIAWSRSVFSREPWQLCHIFGRDSNGTAVHALHGLRNGTLMHRPFGVVQKFDW